VLDRLSALKHVTGRLDAADRLVGALGEEFMGDTDTIRSAVARRSMFNVIHFVYGAVVIRAARYLGYGLCRPMPYGE
jgi:hypothetical protein